MDRLLADRVGLGTEVSRVHRNHRQPQAQARSSHDQRPIKSGPFTLRELRTFAWHPFMCSEPGGLPRRRLGRLSLLQVAGHPGNRIKRPQFAVQERPWSPTISMDLRRGRSDARMSRASVGRNGTPS